MIEISKIAILKVGEVEKLLPKEEAIKLIEELTSFYNLNQEPDVEEYRGWVETENGYRLGGQSLSKYAVERTKQVLEEEQQTIAELAEKTNLSKSYVSLALRYLQEQGLARLDDSDRKYKYSSSSKLEAQRSIKRIDEL